MQFKIRYVFIKIIIAFGLSYYLLNSLIEYIVMVQEAGAHESYYIEWFHSFYGGWQIGFFLSGYFAVTLLSIFWSKGKIFCGVLVGFFCFAIAGAFVINAIGCYMDIQNGAKAVNIGIMILWGLTALLLLWAPVYDIVSAVKVFGKREKEEIKRL